MIKYYNGIKSRIKYTKLIINEIHNKKGIKKSRLFIDIIYSDIKYKCRPIDYKVLEFYKKDKRERSTYFFSSELNIYEKKIFNNVDYKIRDIFFEKHIFNEYFNKYIGRKYALVNNINFEEFKEFINEHKIIACKLKNAWQGIGFEKINIDDIRDIELKYNDLKENDALLEEYINQHTSVSNISSSSVNTIRVETLIYDDKFEIPGYLMRIGNGKNIDAWVQGGMIVEIDSESGKIISNGIDKNLNEYDKHPISNIEFIGYQLPMWDEVKKLISDVVDETRKISSNIRLVGWDIAITDKGPIIVEGNLDPDPTMIQVLNKKGTRGYYNNLIDYINNM